MPKPGTLTDPPMHVPGTLRAFTTSSRTAGHLPSLPATLHHSLVYTCLTAVQYLPSPLLLYVCAPGMCLGKAPPRKLMTSSKCLYLEHTRITISSVNISNILPNNISNILPLPAVPKHCI